MTGLTKGISSTALKLLIISFTIISFRINDTRAVTGRKFLRTLSVQDLRAVYLDDVPVKDLVTSTGDHVIGGTVVFSRFMAQTVTLAPGGTVGGIDISEEVVTLDGDATLGVFWNIFYIQ